MEKHKDKVLLFIGLILSLGFFGCASTNDTTSARLNELNRELATKDQEISKLRVDVEEKQETIVAYKEQLGNVQSHSMSASTDMGMSTSSDLALLPSKAKTNECYARVFVPPTYKTFTEQVLKKGAAEKLVVNPARFEWVEEQVLIQEASTKLEVVPAEYAWVEEKVLVNPAFTKMEEIPAKYEMITEKVLIKPAYTVWKRGRGLIEKVDNNTGEIMCLVEIPASYRTIEKRVMTSPPSTTNITIPEKYDTIKKRVMVKPPITRTIEIPASYKTVKVKKIITPAQEQRITIPAEYDTITKTELVTDGKMEWRRVLCETNVSPAVISQIQKALLESGHDPGPIDGILGMKSRAALKTYQKEKGLAVGELTYNTLNSLGVKLSQ